MRNLLLIVGSGLLAILLAGPNYAENKRPCREDVRRYCKTQLENGDNAGIVRCLKANDARISGQCKVALEKRLKFLKALSVACAADEKKYCAKAGERKLNCLMANRKNLSPACRTTIDDFFRKKKG